MGDVGAGHAREKVFAGTKNSCPGTRMARSYKRQTIASCGVGLRGWLSGFLLDLIEQPFDLSV
jgi:hypothetical protein